MNWAPAAAAERCENAFPDQPKLSSDSLFPVKANLVCICWQGTATHCVNLRLKFTERKYSVVISPLKKFLRKLA